MPCDYRLYPANWKTEIVPRILKRAKGKCEQCRVPNHSTVHSLRLKVAINGSKPAFRCLWFRIRQDAERVQYLSEDPLKAVRVVLTVAHLDHDEGNADVTDDRLQAMCQYCHLKYDRAEHYRRKGCANNETI